MTRNALVKIAASGMIAVFGIGAPTAMVLASDSDAPRANPSRAARSAERANDNLERGRLEQAVRFAEEAVAFAPADPAHRTLLGQVYLASGRFASAEESFDAARQLGATGSDAVIGHVLAMIAVGNNAEAMALLEANASTLPASDYGLALALAGQPERGAMVLTDVVRAGGATARDRQNLALSYALAGRWLEARLIAAQDVGAANVGARMEQWAAMTQAGDPRQRIAGLLGTSPSEDPGMPVRLALRDGAPQAVQLARNDDPAPLAMYAPGVPGDAVVAQADSAELVEAMIADNEAGTSPGVQSVPQPVVEVAVATPPAADGIRYISEPVIQQMRGVVAMVAPLANPQPAAAAAAAAPAARPVRVAGRATVAAPVVAAPAAPVAAATRAAPTGPVRTSGWAVQLGAFDSVGVARDAWGRLSRRHAALGARDAISTSATVNGTAFFRLAATGFDSRGDASAVCARVRRAGGNCFVRQLDGRDTVRWASRSVPTRVAAR